MHIVWDVSNLQKSKKPFTAPIHCCLSTSLSVKTKKLAQAVTVAVALKKISNVSYLGTNIYLKVQYNLLKSTRTTPVTA